MRRILLSLFGGIVLTLGTPIIATLIFFPGNRDAAIAFLFDWPLLVMERLGLGPDCRNANSVAEKLSCVRLGIYLDLVCYPLIIVSCSCVIYLIVFRRVMRARLRQT